LQTGYLLLNRNAPFSQYSILYANIKLFSRFGNFYFIQYNIFQIQKHIGYDTQPIMGACTKSLWNQVAVIQPLLHHDQWMRASFLDTLHRGNDELCIDVGVFFHLFVLVLGSRTLHPLMQVLAELILTQSVGDSTLLGIHRGFIWKVLFQPCRWRTVHPPLRAESRQEPRPFM